MNEIQRMRNEHKDDHKRGAEHPRKNPRTHLPEKMTDADRAAFARAMQAMYPTVGDGDGGRALHDFDVNTDGKYRVDQQEDEDGEIPARPQLVTKTAKTAAPTGETPTGETPHL